MTDTYEYAISNRRPSLFNHPFFKEKVMTNETETRSILREMRSVLGDDGISNRRKLRGIASLIDMIDSDLAKEMPAEKIFLASESRQLENSKRVSTL